ncbi:zinc-binding alcohol dehydrogenase family protein [Streptomyces olivaceoviridis]|uniref:zinc-binding alcohol dehydrogenase family protein n=1 Tax=Streptomyces olivaceoviridis TaxID=1921 RepID=UPI0037AACFA4
MDTSKVASSEDSPGVEDGSPDTMRAVVMKEAGDAEVLRVAELPAPHAGAGEVRISVNAATVNAGDLLLRQGGGPSVVEILGMDAAGIIDEIGPGTTTDLKLGDRVMAFVQPLRPAGGAYAQKVVLPANWVVQAPQGTSDVEASTLPMNGLTAMLAIDTLALSPGETVAVTGAAGGLGGYVVQLAHIAGLRVIADAAPADVDLVRSLGADIVVARGDAFAAQVREHVPAGVDGLVDTAVVGAAALGAIRDNGILVNVRPSAGPGSAPLHPERGIDFRLISVADYGGRQDKLEQLRRHVEHGRLTLRVAATFSPEHAAQAHRRLEAGGTRGRLVIDFSEAAGPRSSDVTIPAVNR